MASLNLICFSAAFLNKFEGKVLKVLLTLFNYFLNTSFVKETFPQMNNLIQINNNTNNNTTNNNLTFISSSSSSSIFLPTTTLLPSIIIITSTTSTISSTSSSNNNNLDIPPHIIQRSIAEMVEILMYSLCLCIGGPLNLFSFYRLISQIRRPIFRQQQQFGAQLNLLKLHLNIADLITMFVYTLSQIIWMITYQWHFGDFLCRIIKFFHTFSFYLNSFIVACFAIDRFLGTRNLNNPISFNIAQKRMKKMLIFAWTWATLLSIPQFFIFRVFEPLELKNFKQCTPIWTIIGYELDLKMGTLNESDIEGKLRIFQQFNKVVAWERFYNMAHLLFLFWIPSLLIAASYTAILITLNSLSVVPEKNSTTNNIFNKKQQKYSLQQETILNENNNLNNYLLKEEEEKNNLLLNKKEENKLILINNLRKESKTRGNNNTKIGLIAPLTIAKARQNAKRQAALILAAYLTFWSPYNLLAICNAWAQKDGTIRHISTITLPFLNGLIVVNPIVNPLIYGVFDEFKLLKKHSDSSLSIPSINTNPLLCLISNKQLIRIQIILEFLKLLIKN
ncbi:G_PROTEIN_RECEP_F1_2 domain-containing protein [Meloidogyne graminicola]|uniref:G_PROTEIN_RECEP_F1_2 domain-containing protein n=1 Tax=Meloidogyne graminicola TaxID=189291 RepID=A0A8S9ZVX3_9BILA|nr:G_PROTEIN_RECEP_F1_2 domain-containing protein [Meloidogyne graminicola]